MSDSEGGMSAGTDGGYSASGTSPSSSSGASPAPETPIEFIDPGSFSSGLIPAPWTDDASEAVHRLIETTGHVIVGPMEGAHLFEGGPMFLVPMDVLKRMLGLEGEDTASLIDQDGEVEGGGG